MPPASALIVASNFPPIHSGGVYRTLRLVKYLPEHDWTLNVLTLSESTLPHGTVVDEGLTEQIPASTRIYRADARFPLDRLNSIRALAKSPRHKNGTNPKSSGSLKSSIKDSSVSRKRGRLQSIKDRVTLPFMTPDRLIGWVRPATRLGLHAVRAENVDLIYSSAPPFSNHLVGRALKAKSGKPWIADFRDPWLGNAFRPNREGDDWLGKRHRQLEHQVFEDADQVIFNTERSRADAVTRFGKSLAEKSVVIPNGFDPAHFSQNRCKLTENDADGRALDIVHTGSFYGGRNVDVLIVALGELSESGRIKPGDLTVRLIGNTRQHEQQLIARSHVEDFVHLVPPMSHQDCISQLRKADVLLLVQTGAPLCVPGKLYEYIAIGKPILTFASDGATADLVRQESLGPCIDPGDSETIKSTLLELVHAHSTGFAHTPNGDARVKYDGQNQMKAFDAIFRKVL